MKKTGNIISLTTVVVLLYVILSTLAVPFALVFLFFLISSALLLWMVFRILKDNTHTSAKTFDTHFYEDVD